MMQNTEKVIPWLPIAVAKHRMSSPSSR